MAKSPSQRGGSAKPSHSPEPPAPATHLNPAESAAADEQRPSSRLQSLVVLFWAAAFFLLFLILVYESVSGIVSYWRNH
jgi:hypothetical protein